VPPHPTKLLSDPRVPIKAESNQVSGIVSHRLRGAENGMKPNRDSNRTRGIPFRLDLLALWVLGPCLSFAAQSPETIQKIQQLLQQGDSLNAQAFPTILPLNRLAH